MKKLTINKSKFKLEEEIKQIIDTTVRPIGNGAMALIPKQHMNKKVYVLIRKE